MENSMKITQVFATNFASYKEINFDFSNQGLCLIEGPTGSGKSTLCDLIPWALFSRTAKGGSVSEVLSWPGDKVTTADITLSTGQTIHRSRGPKSGDNDLLILSPDGDIYRGKDLNDTQKLINNLLGFDAELYLSGAYFHEFSQTVQFFTTTAKNRRTICEQIVDLELAKKLQLNTSEQIKVIHPQVSKLMSDSYTLNSNIELLERLQIAETTKVNDWENSRKLKLLKLENQCEFFENTRWAKIEKLEDDCIKELKQDICKECGSIKIKGAGHISKCKARYNVMVDEERTKENPFYEYIAVLKNDINPHLGGAKDYSDELYSKKDELGENELQLERLQQQYTDLELLKDVVNDFRSALVKNTISQLEHQTNELLTDHFDAEIRVRFQVEEADKLEVEITKDGNLCSYTQLSKGQRQLLKLCFGVSVMKSISNHNGINFGQIFFDEALDGMDDNVKIKSFSLFTSLSTQYESVFVVDHSEAIKSMFTKEHSVRLVDGHSQIEET